MAAPPIVVQQSPRQTKYVRARDFAQVARVARRTLQSVPKKTDDSPDAIAPCSDCVAACAEWRALVLRGPFRARSLGPAAARCGDAGTAVAFAEIMTTNNSQVVVGYDFSHSSKPAMYRAIALATRAPFHVLHFVCVIEPHGEIPDLPHHGRVDYAYAEHVQKALTDVIAEELRAASIADRVHFYVHARIGKPADEILALAREVGADLIIVGSKGSVGVERMVLGSVSEHVVREAGCTVEVARPKAYDYVELLDIKTVEATHHYVPPHRYTYDQHCATMRPDEWPLY